MATDLEKLLVRVEANLKQYEKEMARARGIGVKAMREVERETTRSVSRIEQAWARAGGAVKAGIGGFVAGLGVEQLARAAATAIKSIADIGDQATKLGITTDEFQIMSMTAQLAGTEVEAFASSMKKLGINSSDASRGQGEFGAILKANNISLMDANGQMRSQVEILGIVADLVKNAANEQDQLAIAQAAMGKSGTEMMGLLVQGAAGVSAAYGQAKNEVARFSPEMIARMQEIDDKIDVLTKNIAFGLKDAFGSAAIGAIDFASIAIENLDAVGIKAADVGEGIMAFYRNIPGFGPLVQFGEAAMARGRAVNAADANAKRNIARPAPETYRPGKGDLPNANPTIVPSQADDRAARDAEAAEKRKQAAIERRREQIKGVISDLKFEGEQLKRNDLQQEISNELRRAGVSATSEQGRAIASIVTANHALEQSQKAQKENTELNKKAEEELVRIRIDAAEEARQAQMDLVQEQRDSLMQLAEMGYAAFESVADGSMKAKDAVKQLGLQLVKAATQALLFGQGPFASLLGGGGKKGGGLFGKIIGGLLGGSAKIFHNGGIVGSSSAPSRNVPMAAFANAPRYHSGGIAGFKPGEVPAVLQKGEMVIPRGGAAPSAGGEVHVVVHTSPELWAEVDRRDNQTAGMAVRVSVAESARTTRKNFKSTSADVNRRQG